MGPDNPPKDGAELKPAALNLTARLNPPRVFLQAEGLL
jgi:hypothetical protein